MTCAGYKPENDVMTATILQNSYEARQEAKRARLKKRAEQALAQSSTLYNRAVKMSEAIPFGQPILIGHHSEGRDRNYRKKINSTYEKSFALQNKAQHYESKAVNVGTGGISSDDPDAIIKLRKQLAELERNQEMMKAVNKAVRRNKTHESQMAAMLTIGINKSLAAQLLEKDRFGNIGFAGCTLTNNNNNIKRFKARIMEIEKRRNRVDIEEVRDNYIYREDVEGNRVMFIFNGKPEANIRAILKSHAFKWSPSRGAWVRQLNNAGLWAAKKIRAELQIAFIDDTESSLEK